MRNLFFLVLFLLAGVVAGQNVTAQSYCPQITESLAKHCKNTPADLCEIRDELLFQKLVRSADRANSTNSALFEKYQNLLKAPATKTNLKDLAALTEEASPCVTAIHQLWMLLMKQATVQTSRKSVVQNLIRKKLLSADLHSFTWDSLKMRVFVIDEAVALQLIELSENQAIEWKSVKQSIKESKVLIESINNGPAYSEKSQKVTTPSQSNEALKEQLNQLNTLFSRLRALHQQINNIFA